MQHRAMMSFITSSSMGLPLHQQTHVKGPSSNADPCTAKHQSQNKLPMAATYSSSRPTIPAGISSIPKKPMRPLTGYHIFFQIEREYIIQTTPGSDADESIHDNKVYLDDVPQRYRNIKLLPDWCAGPGKRKKRKHRKQHGKIGFLELSRVISTRWAQLEESDPETKNFVQKIAKAELDVYYREMKEYKELTKDLVPAAAKSISRATISKKKAKKRISSSGASHPYMPMQQPHMTPFPDPVSSLHPVANSIPTSSMRLKNDIDHFLLRIDDSTKHLLPVVSFGSDNQMSSKRKICQPQDDDGLVVSSLCFDPQPNASIYVDMNIKKQVVRSPNNVVSRGSSTSSSMDLLGPKPVEADEVDICDDEILKLWRSHH